MSSARWRHADAPRAHLQAAHGEAQLHRREARADLAQHLALVARGNPRTRPRRCAGRPASGWRAPRPGPCVPLSIRKAVMPPREPRSGSVTAMAMVKSALAMRLIQILRPLITQSIAVLHRARLHAGRIAAGARLGDGDRRGRLARAHRARGTSCAAPGSPSAASCAGWASRAGR